MYWYSFTYKDSTRVAYVPPQGPAFQVMKDGEIEQGFRNYQKNRMKRIRRTTNRFDLIPLETIEQYPELKDALIEFKD